MSGGSYDYLCFKDAGELVHGYEAQLESMIDRLASVGYAEDAAKESMDLLLEVRAYRVRVDAMIARLSPVWKAVEWWDSGDSGPDDLKESLAEYRQNKAGCTK
jgi:hypothetical protein